MALPECNRMGLAVFMLTAVMDFGGGGGKDRHYDKAGVG